MTERQLQIRIVRMLRERGIFHFHCPSEGVRSGRQAAILQRMGVVAGIPDLIIPIPHERDAHPWCGLAMEVKRPGGRLSRQQKIVLATFQALGWRVAVVRSVEEAEEAIGGINEPIQNRVD